MGGEPLTEPAEAQPAPGSPVASGFGLIETMRFAPGEGLVRLAGHLERLRASAEHFRLSLDAQRVRAALERATAGLGETSRVRLVLDAAGDVRVESERLHLGHGVVRLGLAPSPVDPASPWLRHKTTRREPYDAALRSRPAADEVLLWNTRGEVTEATRANLVAELEASLVTPPLESGLLPGVLRSRLLQAGGVREAVIRVSDLGRCRRLWLVSSLRGWREALLAPDVER
jgi:para-aminobenzoate synthetase/4-amino-4-deoxychorismate lyase